MLSFPTRFITLWVLLVVLPFWACAQQNPADIRPMLKSLTQHQKLQLQEYLRHLGVNIDDQIQNAYLQVSAQNQQKAVRFIEILKQDPKQVHPTSVRWDRDTLFFGDLEEGASLIDSFRVTNTGNTPYLISGTKAICDCIVHQVPEYLIMPGETAVLRLEFDSSGKLGPVNPAVIVYDNSFPNKRSILYLKGNITARKKLRKYPWED